MGVGVNVGVGVKVAVGEAVGVREAVAVPVGVGELTMFATPQLSRPGSSVRVNKKRPIRPTFLEL